MQRHPFAVGSGASCPSSVAKTTSRRASFRSNRTLGNVQASANRFERTIRAPRPLAQPECPHESHRVVRRPSAARHCRLLPVEPGRDGRSMLGPLLESHAPLDWVVILLGTNDCGPTYRRDAGEIAFGCATLLWTVLKASAGPAGRVPHMLLVSPPAFGKFSPFMELFFRGGEATGRALASAYATVAEACGARFLDAASVLPPGPVDGVHPDAEGHRRLGEAISKVITG